ncbi:MAG: HAD family hydrolase [Vicinamibacterales bacterium]
MIRTVFLDAGGVLVHPSWTRVSETLAAEGVSVPPRVLETADRRARREIDEAALVRETNDASRGWVYFNKVLTQARIPLTAQTDRALERLREYHATENLWEHVPADVVPLLERLRSEGRTLVVVSNANGRLHRLFDRVGLTRHVDVILDSHAWGVEKPDPGLFRLALEQSGGRAEETVHVGDLYHVDVAGARAAGLAGAVLFDPGGLYPEADCPRIPRLEDLPAALDAFGPNPAVGA